MEKIEGRRGINDNIGGQCKTLRGAAGTFSQAGMVGVC